MDAHTTAGRYIGVFTAVVRVWFEFEALFVWLSVSLVSVLAILK